jgi:hypothetical protein
MWDSVLHDKPKKMSGAAQLHKVASRHHHVNTVFEAYLHCKNKSLAPGIGLDTGRSIPCDAVDCALRTHSANPHLANLCIPRL